MEQSVSLLSFRQQQIHVQLQSNECTINAASKYIEVMNTLDKKKALVTFSYENQFLKLETDPTDKFAATITGKLIKNPALDGFGINSQKTFTATDLVSFLKLNRIYFLDKSTCATLVAKLSNVKAEAQLKINQADDNRGNQKKSADMKVETNVPLDFTLSVPIFKGAENVKFKVEICLEVRDAEISLWLESPELQELIIGGRKTAIDIEIAKFAGFICIEAQ